MSTIGETGSQAGAETAGGKPDCAGKSKFFNGTCNKCGAHGQKRVDCPAEAVAHLELESVTETIEEPAEIESLAWLCALEHDVEEAMASPTDAGKTCAITSGQRIGGVSLFP